MKKIFLFTMLLAIFSTTKAQRYVSYLVHNMDKVNGEWQSKTSNDAVRYLTWDGDNNQVTIYCSSCLDGGSMTMLVQLKEKIADHTSIKQGSFSKWKAYLPKYSSPAEIIIFYDEDGRVNGFSLTLGTTCLYFDKIKKEQ